MNCYVPLTGIATADTSLFWLKTNSIKAECYARLPNVALKSF